MRVSATIIKWSPGETYGFAKPEHGTRDIFLRASAFILGAPYVGARIECEVEPDFSKRNDRAENIHVVSGPIERVRPAPGPPKPSARAPAVEPPTDRTAKIHSRSKHERLRDPKN